LIIGGKGKEEKFIKKMKKNGKKLLTKGFLVSKMVIDGK